MKVTIWQVCSRHIQHRIVPRGLRRDPSPRRIDHLYHTPVTLCDHPTPRAPNQLVARLNIEHQSIWGASYAHQMEALHTGEQITPITTIKRHRTSAGRVRHRPRSLDDSGGRSPLIIKDLDLYPQPPTNTRSPILNSEEPENHWPNRWLTALCLCAGLRSFSLPTLAALPFPALLGPATVSSARFARATHAVP